jgi:NAD(P)-dependent dehydrogenase (short-subunit alcohol dehydrogenase family)
MSDATSDERPVALITGASGGIGAASAAGLAEDGFDIVVTARDKSTLAKTLGRIEAAGGQALALSLDVRNQEQIVQCFDDAIARFGHVDVLVNNAGVPTPRNPIVETSPEDWDAIMDINVKGAFFVAAEFAKRLIAGKRPGQVINFSSTFSFIGMPNVAVYGMSKTAMGGMTRMMAIEWAEHGIRANAVAPGATATEGRREAFKNPVFMEKIRGGVPLGRVGEPEEVANAIRYLASPGASYVNGHSLVIDGGFIVK